MTHARIEANIAVEIYSGDPTERYHPDLAARFVPVPDAVVVGSRFQNGVWVPPTPDEAVPPARVPLQLAIIDFLRLFTPSELAGFNAVKKACAELTTDDYQAAAEGDPAKGALVGFEVFLTFYDALRAGLIELNHPDTIQGLSLLVPLGVLTAPRLAAVLAGEVPA